MSHNSYIKFRLIGNNSIMLNRLAKNEYSEKIFNFLDRTKRFIFDLTHIEGDSIHSWKKKIILKPDGVHEWINKQLPFEKEGVKCRICETLYKLLHVRNLNCHIGHVSHARHVALLAHKRL